MDFLQAGAKIAHLLKDEITHELSIRKLPVNPLSRRDSLCQALKQTALLARRGSLKFTGLVPSEATSELNICQRKAEDMEKEIKEDLSTSAIARLTSRCRYILCRLSRLADDTEEVQLLKALVNTMMERLKGDDSASSADPDSDEECVSLTNNPVVQKIIYKPESHFNANSLNLKFKGDSCPRTFLTRLEELRVARRIPEDRIFCAFPELLDGPALSWFRSTRSTFTSYRDVTVALKEEFDIPDLDFLLLQEIRARTQSKDETIVTFLATILGMFERLTNDVSDAEKLDIVTRNIRPEYSCALALHEVTSVQQLKSLCKQIELARAKADQFREPCSSNTTYTF